MADYKFSIPIAVRYGDLDPQWHVNNARYLTFLEQMRLTYLQTSQKTIPVPVEWRSVISSFEGIDFS